MKRELVGLGGENNSKRQGEWRWVMETAVKRHVMEGEDKNWDQYQYQPHLRDRRREGKMEGKEKEKGRE